MFKALFFSGVLLFLLESCSKKPLISTKDNNAVNHISIIIDDEWWNGEVGDSLRNKLAGPAIGLPEEEPLFTINQYPLKILEGFIADNRSIVVVKKQALKKIEIRQIGTNKNQQIIYLCGNTVPEVIDLLERNSAVIIDKIKYLEFIYTRTQLNACSNYIPYLSNFNIQLKLPRTYKKALRADNFYWFKKDIIGGNMNILIYRVGLNSRNMNIQKIRDSIGVKYIHGTALGSNMLTASISYTKSTSIAALEAIETRGMWELKNDFMAGPYLNYAIIDSTQNKLLFVEGFCYAPSKNKRDLMFELETIIKSLKVTNGHVEN